ncbi:MAG: hypothetical protein ACPGXK_14885 [Phycisphaerae bacterium]
MTTTDPENHQPPFQPDACPTGIPGDDSGHDALIRTWTEVRELAVVVQANLVQLLVADAKRQGLSATEHPLQVPSPGAVTACREHLIDRHTIQSYADDEIRIRLREVFGQYCLFVWAFHASDPGTDFASLATDTELRCNTVMQAKVEELNALLWKLRFEQARRGDKSFEESSEFAGLLKIAERIPAEVAGKPARLVQSDALLASAIEHAGMLAAARWLADHSKQWNEPGLMDVYTPQFD